LGANIAYLFLGQVAVGAGRVVGAGRDLPVRDRHYQINYFFQKGRVVGAGGARCWGRSRAWLGQVATCPYRACPYV